MACQIQRVKRKLGIQQPPLIEMKDSFLGLIVQELDAISVTVGPTVVAGVRLIGAILPDSLVDTTNT